MYYVLEKFRTLDCSDLGICVLNIGNVMILYTKWNTLDLLIFLGMCIYVMIFYKILELNDERINFKNSRIEICAECRIWADSAVVGHSNFWIPKRQVKIFLWILWLRKFNFKYLFRNIYIFFHLCLLNGKKCVLIFVLVSALWRIYLIRSFSEKIHIIRNVDL